MNNLEKFKNLGELLNKTQMKKILGGYTGECDGCNSFKCCDIFSGNCTKCSTTNCTCSNGRERQTCYFCA